MEHDLPLSGSFFSPLSEGTPTHDHRQKTRVIPEHLRTQDAEKDREQAVVQRGIGSKKGGRGKKRGGKGKRRDWNRRMNGWERSGETLNPIR
jgi:hypothetical protein